MKEIDVWAALKAHVNGCGTGLCGALDFINPPTPIYKTIQAKIEAEAARLDKSAGSYIWPLTRVGQDYRLAFCDRMIEQLKRIYATIRRLPKSPAR